MSDRFALPIETALDLTGAPLSGAKLFFYENTTIIKKNTYSNTAKTTANANPVIADSAGRFGTIFLEIDAPYTVVLTTAADTDPPASPIWTEDDVSPILTTSIPSFPILLKSANYTVLTSDKGALILVDASAGPVTITLPALADIEVGFPLSIKKTDSSANIVTVDGNLAETIDGLTTVALGVLNNSLGLSSAAAGWQILSEKRLPTPTVSTANEIVTVNAGGTGFTTSTNPLPTGHLTGLTISNNATDATNDIDIAAGKCRDDADTANVALASAVGKQLDVSWSTGGTPGAPTGGLSSSLTLTNDTTYHAIAGLVSGTTEIGFDTSITGANLVTDHSFTNTRRIGSVDRKTAANQLFIQDGDRFDLMVPVTDVSVTNPGTSAVTRTLSVPTGISVIARCTMNMTAAAGSSTLAAMLTALDTTDTAVSSNLNQLRFSFSQATSYSSGGGEVTVRTDTSAQIRSRLGTSTASISFRINTFGWIDRRGRDG